MEAVVSSLIVGVLSLIGVIITSRATNAQVQAQILQSQAVTDTKLENLTKEVQRNSEIIMKLPVLENRVTTLEKTHDTERRQA